VISEKRGKDERGDNSVTQGNQPWKRNVFSGNTKRRLGAAGVANILIKNVSLQILLLIPALPVWIFTLCSQIINGTIGIQLYGRWVFRAKAINRHNAIPRYSLMLAAIWQAYWALINLGVSIGMNRNLAGPIIISPIAACSYLIQKHWVFKRQWN